MKKWIKVTLLTLLTLVVLAGVGAAGYRLGLTQNPEIIKQLTELRAQRYSRMQQVAPQGKDAKPQQLPGSGMVNPRGSSDRSFNPHSRFNRGDRFGYDGFFSPLFGLVRLAVLALLVWLGYKYIKSSGWKIVREPQPAAATDQSAPAEEEKKDRA